MKKIVILVLVVLTVFSLFAAEKAKPKEPDKKPETISAETFAGLAWRGVGPAHTSGRIADFAVNPADPKQIYVGVASGHIWKTDNAGITWSPVFENYGSYAIGCLAMDPTNPNVVWAGTGENNHQRALGYGDGVYKTIDAGKSWTQMGLKDSRQIGDILINPKNPDMVYVAAEGSAWGPGGDRGFYKTTDGGKTWTKVLSISENTGVASAVMDPRDPDVIIVTSEQRRRHVFTKIGGGPETAFHKTTDGGKTWRKITSGLPSADMGGIGLAISPANPDVVYAIIEAAGDASGFYRSTDRGESWSKMSSHSAQGQYYNEIVCDPKDVDTIYSTETVSHVSRDGGRTWTPLGLDARHVDDHAIWIDTRDTAHFLIGGDGGIYETYDGGAKYRFVSNLPVTQFYRVTVDDSLPFYYIYGGTQDNNSMGGPSRNTSTDGVTSDEWFFTVGGDGFVSQVDPKDPNIVYSEWQYGNIVRYDRKSMESFSIKPQPAKGELTFRWFWDTPFLISPHSNTRLYIAAERVFRSDDRGDSWKEISGDLTAKIDRNSIPVMGKYWSVDAVAKDVSTSQYGLIVSLAESPLKEGLIFVGTDDGLIQVTENGGQNWRKIDSFPSVPARTYVSDVFPSRFDENVVFAAFNNTLNDDFNPYLLKSGDKGRTWTPIAAGLPQNGGVHTIVQDPVNPDLLFAGTEFGVFASVNGGKEWFALKNGMPTISVKDLTIQRRENDLVAATFGRGIFVLDDYTPLRLIKPEDVKNDFRLFPVKDALAYIRTSVKYGQGATYFLAPNPAYGAVFTYFLKESPQTQKQIRQKRDKDLFEKGEKIPIPSLEEQRREGMEHKPYLQFTVADEAGRVVRVLRTAPSPGVNRVVWDLSYASPSPVGEAESFDPFRKDDSGFMVMPGRYSVSAAKVVDNTVTPLGEAQPFAVKALANVTLAAENRPELVAFQNKVGELTRAAQGTYEETEALAAKVRRIRQTAAALPGGPAGLLPALVQTEKTLDEIRLALGGYEVKASFEEVPPAPLPIRNRIEEIVGIQISTTSAPGRNQLDSYRIACEELAPVIKKLETLKTVDLPALEKSLDEQKAPWTPGRIIKIGD
ncbi:MAG: glycosyl hydrolase [Candidatus Aminicenantes bacterium]|nr:glycosyl hydrolase [Candidatus Aminicenantes bacterium]